MIDSIIAWIKSIVTYFINRPRTKDTISEFKNNKNRIDGNVIQANRDVIDNSQNKNEFNSHIGDVSSSLVAQNASNVTIVNNTGIKPDDIVQLFENLACLETYKIKANEIATQRYNEFMSSFESRLNSIEDKLNGFADPSMQMISREAITGFITHGSEDKGEFLIDLLIERLENNEHTSKQSLIEEAIRILPKLSKKSVAILALLSYIYYTIHRTRDALKHHIKCMDPILELLPRENKMDILYLSQMNCITQLNTAHIERDLIKKSKKDYPLAFSKPIDVEHSREFMQKYGISRTNSGLTFNTDSQNKNILQEVFLLNRIFSFNEDGTITPNLLNNDIYREVLQQNKYTEEMISDVETLLSYCSVASDNDIISFYVSINPKWSLAIKMLNDKPLNEYKLQPLGRYIGSRQIFKLAGKKMSIDEIF